MSGTSTTQKRTVSFEGAMVGAALGMSAWGLAVVVLTLFGVHLMPDSGLLAVAILAGFAVAGAVLGTVAAAAGRRD